MNSIPSAAHWEAAAIINVRIITISNKSFHSVSWKFFLMSMHFHLISLQTHIWSHIISHLRLQHSLNSHHKLTHPQWFDASPALRVAIITGSGPKAFCAGQDLIEQAHFKTNPPPMSARRHPPEGFCGISRRVGKKPVIAAVNGFALGGGFEICLNWYVLLFVRGNMKCWWKIVIWSSRVQQQHLACRKPP